MKMHERSGDIVIKVLAKPGAKQNSITGNNLLLTCGMYFYLFDLIYLFPSMTRLYRLDIIYTFVYLLRCTA